MQVIGRNIWTYMLFQDFQAIHKESVDMDAETFVYLDSWVK